MPTNAGSIGVDYSFGYYDTTTNSMIDLGDVQTVDIKPLKTDVKNMPYNGAPLYDFIPDGYDIKFSITRTNAQLESLQAAREVAFYQDAPTPGGYFMKSVRNLDGSTNVFQYQRFVFFLTDQGTVSRDKLVTISCEGKASTMVQLS